MKIRIFAIAIIILCLLSGCKSKSELYPKIREYGETDLIFDDVNIQVYKAKRGLKGYEIIENENSIDVIFHYDKLEQKGE